MEILNEIEKHIVFLGFSVRKFGKNVVVIEGVPPDVRTGKEEIILREVIEQYQEYKHRDILSVQDAVAKSYACRGSIMSGDRLSHSEMNSLIDQLFSTEMPYVCPHVAELDKMFGRT
ncbi:hypothetical protein CHS0354_000444 [Potamilus streckersoni]|uniref:MutL C-terminal dimerisation domain-containing protein n=1 Tax=Potamilus streckersoni TaxID=2493646 RepID=A0AAE0W7X4_9BIVA|nr:hypothetical protein CHS0354_000444 [Potamilus streckersoni]